MFRRFKNIRRVSGWLVIAALLVAAGGMLCSAPALAGQTSDCTGSHGSVAVCPFLAGSAQALVDPSLQTKQVALALLGLSVVLIWVYKSGRGEDWSNKLLAYLRQYFREVSSDWVSSPILRLISRGVLQPKIFAF